MKTIFMCLLSALSISSLQLWAAEKDSDADTKQQKAVNIIEELEKDVLTEKQKLAHYWEVSQKKGNMTDQEITLNTALASLGLAGLKIKYSLKMQEQAHANMAAIAQNLDAGFQAMEKRISQKLAGIDQRVASLEQAVSCLKEKPATKEGET